MESPLWAPSSRVTTIPRLASEDWQVDVGRVEATIRSDTKYLVINEPYNPAGTLMTRENQSRLVEVASGHGIVVFSDEVYRLLEHDPSKRLPAMCDVYSRGISCVTLSKPWGGCGITIGWLAVQDPEIKQKLVDAQYFGTACPSRASEIQAIMTLRASDAILSKNLAIIRRNLALLGSFIHRNEDLFGWVKPTAGAVAFVKFKGPLTSEELGLELSRAGISIKPAYCFSPADSITPDIDYFRVGYGEANMPRALEALEEFVKCHRASWTSSVQATTQS